MKRKRYEHIESLVDDPADYAVANELVGSHSPETRRLVGAWRWPLVQKYRKPILETLRRGRVIDFGGSAGPIGYGAVIVDHEADDKALYDVPGQWSGVFSSHTLEHVVDVRLCVEAMVAKLHDGGVVIVHVPSWHVEGLRAENWPHHCQTFCLSVDRDAPPAYTRLDSLFALRCTAIVGEDDGQNIIYAGMRVR